jgi:hypothetical protein
LVAIGVCVPTVKYEVVFLRKHLKKINEEIEKLEDDAKVYAAEWSCLNSPKRLKMLAAKYLKNMKPMERRQIMSYEEFASSEFETSLRDAFKTFLDNSLIENSSNMSKGGR